MTVPQPAASSFRLHATLDGDDGVDDFHIHVDEPFDNEDAMKRRASELESQGYVVTVEPARS